VSGTERATQRLALYWGGGGGGELSVCMSAWVWAGGGGMHMPKLDPVSCSYLNVHQLKKDMERKSALESESL